MIIEAFTLCSLQKKISVIVYLLKVWTQKKWYLAKLVSLYPVARWLAGALTRITGVDLEIVKGGASMDANR